jgi:biopolymer transport protein ExbD
VWDRYHRAAESEDLNLIPIMSLFMILIPFLLMGAAFFHMSTIPTSTPQHTPHASDVPKTPKTVTLNLVVKPEALSVTASSTSLTPDELSELAAELPIEGGAYPTARLQDWIAGIKARYPKSNTIIVLPHDDVRYDDLVSILDVTREKKIEEKGKEPAYAELFPVTVFSRFIPPPPPEEGIDGEAAPEGEGAAEEVVQ